MRAKGMPFGFRSNMAMMNKERHKAKVRVEEEHRHRAAAPWAADAECEHCGAQPCSSMRPACCDSQVCSECYLSGMDSGVCGIYNGDPRYPPAEPPQWFHVIERPGADPLCVPVPAHQPTRSHPRRDDRVTVCPIESCSETVATGKYRNHVLERHATYFVAPASRSPKGAT